MGVTESKPVIVRAARRHIPGMLDLLLQVCGVHHECRPDLFKAGARKYTAAELEKMIGDASRPVFIAEDETGRVLGYAFCIFQRHENDNILTDIKTLYIDDLCVDAAARGMGVGSTLYRTVLDFAAAEGCYNVTLNVWAGNEKAMRFYEAMGLSVQKIGMEKILCAGKK